MPERAAAAAAMEVATASRTTSYSMAGCVGYRNCERRQSAPSVHEAGAAHEAATPRPTRPTDEEQTDARSPPPPTQTRSWQQQQAGAETAATGASCARHQPRQQQSAHHAVGEHGGHPPAACNRRWHCHRRRRRHRAEQGRRRGCRVASPLPFHPHAGTAEPPRTGAAAEGHPPLPPPLPTTLPLR